MRIGAIILAAAVLLGAGAAAGVWFTTQASGERIEKLAGGQAQAQGERDVAVQVSEETVRNAVSLIGEQRRIAEIIAESEQRSRDYAAEELRIRRSILRAAPEDRGPMPKVVADTVRSLYEAKAEREGGS